MEIELPWEDMQLAFKELDADGSGDIEIEEFMERMRAEKKWRQRAAMVRGQDSVGATKHSVWVLRPC